jgi:hypothetical protein
VDDATFELLAVVPGDVKGAVKQVCLRMTNAAREDSKFRDMLAGLARRYRRREIRSDSLLVALIPQCAECPRVWVPADRDRWRAYATDDEGELVFFCPVCAGREFDD